MHVAPLPLPTYNQVTKHNLAQLQPMIVQLLKQAAFIALDAEFTGLGAKVELTRARDIQERYQHLCALAKSHALVAFGLSIFIRTTAAGSVEKEQGVDMDKANDDKERAYSVHNFNFSMLIERDYMVSPKSMLFLAENGLDLNQWIMEGIPYLGGDRLANEGGRGNPNGIMRSIFKRIMTKQVPVVVHNGFLDLIFLYHSFYADLPPNLSTFVADLSDMFPAGLYDTKFISDYITRERSSFLAYLFRKYERDDTRAKKENDAGSASKRIYSHFDVQPRLSLPPVQEALITEESGSSSTAYCEDYAYHGVCKKGMRCKRSHDLNLILDAEEEERDAKRRKRQKQKHDDTDQKDAGNPSADPDQAQQTENGCTEASDTTAPSVLPPTTTTVIEATAETTSTASTAVPATTTESVVLPSEKFHSAYFDAFMTGSIFSHQLNQHKPEEIETQAKNRIYLIGKSFPLIVEKSAFAKFSPSHERQRA
ncbi:Target of EGR1, member 1 (Nuclear) [Mortierella polycephala]|uniref:Target of EGR1, member 1 (Nuclear) n=1 Tax=Mortierella polycephala TaxID=41804 RepID=A0A9P6Q2U2_9FUNG|nr:Target of EGR1, member 1 (Nuclear) [Mortierella polycephala]